MRLVRKSANRTYPRIREANKQAAQTTGTVDRRTFLAAGAAAGGGLLLSVSLPTLTRGATAAGAGTFAPNAFVRIGHDGQVTLTGPPCT